MDKEIPDNVLRVDIRHCARCNGDHDQMEFFKLTNPVIADDGKILYTYWGPCPTNQEPVMMHIDED